MDLTKISGLQPTALDPTKTQNKEQRKSTAPDFMDTMKSFLNETNELHMKAADQVESLVSGETTDVHDVMIAMEKASVSFEMVMEIRNRMLEAYQEIMRTQV
ncbi:MAG: flagellar hook-basal body complex protein FliE [Calditrichaeota bacterium]|nr:MAG: flagellar hook-basal body complex protein FliE [Calditrichota bacterium]